MVRLTIPSVLSALQTLVYAEHPIVWSWVLADKDDAMVKELQPRNEAATYGTGLW